MNKLSEWKQILNLAWHIQKNLPPKDGKWHSISFNIKLTSKKPKAAKANLRGEL